MIAMALACKPLLLIADEPTTALDVSVQATILELMQELRDSQDMAMLFISHDLGIVGQIADEVMVMYGGKLMEEGETWNVFSTPKHPYTKGLLACRPRIDLKMKVLPTVSDFVILDNDGSIIERSEAKFNSVGQAIMTNVQSMTDLRERHTHLMEQKPLLQVKNMVVEFSGQKSFFGKPKPALRAVNDVSFDLYPGETLGLVGESGCGKTTLGRAILQLIKPTSGEVWFDGRDLSKISPQEMRRYRRELQIVFQDPYSSLNPRMTIGEAIIEPMRIHGILDSEKQRRERAVELLETVSLNAVHLNRYPHEFSGGQRQRICIARTLAIEPKFVICDESVSALDVSVQAQVLNLLNQLKEKYNLTYISISHDLSVVKFVSDRIMVMYNGQVEEIGFSEDVYGKPACEYTRKLIEAIPRSQLEDIRKATMRRKKAKAAKKSE
jgi:peptide/nickel transport system ATP-binding protein